MARLLRFVAFRLVRRVGRLGAVEAELKASGVEELAPKVVSAIVFWLVLLLFVAAATQVLGLAVVTTGIGQLARFLPGVLAVVVLVVAGVGQSGNTGAQALAVTMRGLALREVRLGDDVAGDPGESLREIPQQACRIPHRQIAGNGARRFRSVRRA